MERNQAYHSITSHVHNTKSWTTYVYLCDALIMFVFGTYIRIQNTFASYIHIHGMAQSDSYRSDAYSSLSSLCMNVEKKKIASAKSKTSTFDHLFSLFQCSCCFHNPHWWSLLMLLLFFPCLAAHGSSQF